jgi:hypothetical protein
MAMTLAFCDFGLIFVWTMADVCFGSLVMVNQRVIWREPVPLL